MSDPLFDDEDDAATPLSPDEKSGLIPSYITLRRELNEAEQLGIMAAEEWAFSRKRDVLDERFLRRLHKAMFKEIWRWAGEIRTTTRNIGVDPWKPSPCFTTRLKMLDTGLSMKLSLEMKLQPAFTTGSC